MSKKQDILRAAITLFALKGFKDTSITQVAQMIGVASATVFYHFKNKEELFMAVLQEVREGIVSESQAYFQENEFHTGIDMVEGAVSLYIYLAGIREEWFCLLHRHHAFKLAETNPLCRRYLEDIYNCLVDIFETALRQGQRDGSVDSSLSPRKMALLVLTMVDGIVRLKTDNLYDAGALYNDLILACRRMVANTRN
ncbi:MAG: TetR/AcrR family transcriptional regulator [Thermodesulfobacteriota bacterium]